MRKCLVAQGLRDNTLLFYCGDNGASPNVALHFPHRGIIGSLYEGGTLELWSDPKLQKGTTPLAQLAGNKATRNFRNFHHPPITDTVCLGTLAIFSLSF